MHVMFSVRSSCEDVHMNTLLCLQFGVYSFKCTFPALRMIDSMFIIQKERMQERKMYFYPLCKCNETISPLVLHTICSDFLKKYIYIYAAEMSTFWIFTGTQHYLSAFQATSSLNTSLNTIQLRVEGRKKSILFLPGIEQ